MKIGVERFVSGERATLGLLRLDGAFHCFTLEDIYRPEKVAGETRIPAGSYSISVRTHGGFHRRYSNRFAFHQGMLELDAVPGFTDILIHPGNSHEHTEGCLLVGMTGVYEPEIGGTVLKSVVAYSRLYTTVIAAALAGELTIEIEDRDR